MNMLKPYDKFTGTIVGAADIDRETLSPELLAYLQKETRMLVEIYPDGEKGEEAWNWHCIDLIDDSEEYENLPVEVQEELEKFLTFLEYNDIWWFRFPPKD